MFSKITIKYILNLLQAKRDNRFKTQLVRMFSCQPSFHFDFDFSLDQYYFNQYINLIFLDFILLVTKTLYNSGGWDCRSQPKDALNGILLMEQ